MKTLILIIIFLPKVCFAQRPTYEDSVKLFENTRELKEKLIQAHYVIIKKCDSDNPLDEPLEEWQVIDAANHNNKPPKGMENRWRYRVDAAKIGNLYRVYDFFCGQINRKLGYQYFSTVIRPYKREVWMNMKTKDCRMVYNYKNSCPKDYDPETHKRKIVQPQEERKIVQPQEETKTRQMEVKIMWYTNNRLDSSKSWTYDKIIKKPKTGER